MCSAGTQNLHVPNCWVLYIQVLIAVNWKRHFTTTKLLDFSPLLFVSLLFLISLFPFASKWEMLENAHHLVLELGSAIKHKNKAQEGSK